MLSDAQKVKVEYQCTNREVLSGSTCLSILPKDFGVKLVPDVSSTANYPSTLGKVVIAFRLSEEWEQCPVASDSKLTGTVTYDGMSKTFVVPASGEIGVVDFGSAPRTKTKKVFVSSVGTCCLSRFSWCTMNDFVVPFYLLGATCFVVSFCPLHP